MRHVCWGFRVCSDSEQKQQQRQPLSLFFVWRWFQTHSCSNMWVTRSWRRSRTLSICFWTSAWLFQTWFSGLLDWVVTSLDWIWIFEYWIEILTVLMILLCPTVSADNTWWGAIWSTLPHLPSSASAILWTPLPPAWREPAPPWTVRNLTP